MSQTVLGSSDTLSGGVCTFSLAGDALIILRVVWNLDHSTMTKGVFICLWAVDCHAPPPSFKVIFSFVFPNCTLFFSYQAPCGAALCCSQQWHSGHNSQRLTVTPRNSSSTAQCPVSLPTGNYCSPSRAPRRILVIIQRKIKSLICVYSLTTGPSGGCTAQAGLPSGAPTRVHSSFYQLNSSQEPQDLS